MATTRSSSIAPSKRNPKRASKRKSKNPNITIFRIDKPDHTDTKENTTNFQIQPTTEGSSGVFVGRPFEFKPKFDDAWIKYLINLNNNIPPGRGGRHRSRFNKKAKINGFLAFRIFLSKDIKSYDVQSSELSTMVSHFWNSLPEEQKEGWSKLASIYSEQVKGMEPKPSFNSWYLNFRDSNAQQWSRTHKELTQGLHKDTSKPS
ncbi:MTLalpha1 transcription factor [Diutina catenulata]